MSKLGIIKVADEVANWASKSKRVAAEDVTNVDTPNYKAHYVEKPSFKSILNATKSKKDVSLVATNSMHIQPVNSTANSRFKVASVEDSDEVSRSGNTVSLRKAVMQHTEASMVNSMALKIKKAIFGLFNIALRG